MQSVLILGRQPELGRAELESLYGPAAVKPLGKYAMLVDVDPCLLAFDRLGGSTKFCKMLTTLDTTNWKEIEKFLVNVSPGHAERMPEGKMTLGLSDMGLQVSIKQLEATGLTLKKAIRKSGRSVRLVPNKTSELNSAQIIHNNLTGPRGWELVFIKDGEQTHIVQTVKVQDIDSYTERDRGRPRRDAKVGMLPPKLAQILINLAVGVLPEESRQSICEIPPDEPIPSVHYDKLLLDPFCGTGVVLQEAALMGYKVAGTDLDDRMVSYTKQNLLWLAERHNTQLVDSAGQEQFSVEAGDATNHQWSPVPDLIAAETYLGRPFTERPSAEVLAQTVADCNLIIKKFLKNIHAQIPAGTRLCLAVPAWQTSPDSFKHLSLVDQIEDLGYNRMSFEHAGVDRLIYYRSDQIVAREIIILTKQ